jgi:hypothetical protein
MKKISPSGQRWLKGFHSFFACMWVGADIVVSGKPFFINPASGGELYGITSTMDFIYLFIIIPGAIGVFLTGLIFSLWTNWGWFKHNWISVKWVICLYGVGFGTYPLGPWMSGLDIAGKGTGRLDRSGLSAQPGHALCLGNLSGGNLDFCRFHYRLKTLEKERKSSIRGRKNI